MEKQSNKLRLVALLICLFLGSIGVHRMYVGKVVSGIWMLIIVIFLGWIGIGFIITGIWALIDFIMIASGVFKDGKGLEIIKWTN